MKMHSLETGDNSARGQSWFEGKDVSDLAARGILRVVGCWSLGTNRSRAPEGAQPLKNTLLHLSRHNLHPMRGWSVALTGERAVFQKGPVPPVSCRG